MTEKNASDPNSDGGKGGMKIVDVPCANAHSHKTNEKREEWLKTSLHWMHLSSVAKGGKEEIAFHKQQRTAGERKVILHVKVLKGNDNTNNK